MYTGISGRYCRNNIFMYIYYMTYCLSFIAIISVAKVSTWLDMSCLEYSKTVVILHVSCAMISTLSPKLL